MASGLIALNNAFYANHAASFSATRQSAWQGWHEIARLIPDCIDRGARPDRPLHVLDLACGNLRFERFLADALDDTPLIIEAVDDCIVLARQPHAGDASSDIPGELHLHDIDVLSRLLAGRPMMPDDRERIGASRQDDCDLSVCFGFLHHVPTARLRRAVLGGLIDRTRSGGMIAISFWSFLDDPRLRRKASVATALASSHPPFAAFRPEKLEEGDRLLGWGADPGPVRFCHHFDESEIDAYAHELQAHGFRERCRFSADGRIGALNRYLICIRDDARNC